MSTVVVTSDDFAATVAGNPVVLVDFWATWCGPCKQFSPIFADVSQEFPGAVFATVDVDDCPDLADRFNVRGVPTVVAFRGGELVHAAPGAMTGVALRKLVSTLTA